MITGTLVKGQFSLAAKEDASIRAGGWCERCFKYPVSQFRKVTQTPVVFITGDDLIGFCRFCLNYLERKSLNDPEEHWAKGWGPVLRHNGLLPGEEPMASKELAEKMACYQKALPNSYGADFLSKEGFPLEAAKKLGVGFSSEFTGHKEGSLVFPLTNPEGGTLGILRMRISSERQEKVSWSSEGLQEGYVGAFALRSVSPRAIVCLDPLDQLALISAGAEGALGVATSPWRWTWVTRISKVVLGFNSTEGGEWLRTFQEQAEILHKGIAVIPPPKPFRSFAEAWSFGGEEIVRQAVAEMESLI